MKLKAVIKDVILESKDGYNTPAAIDKQAEIKKKKIKTKPSWPRGMARTFRTGVHFWAFILSIF